MNEERKVLVQMRVKAFTVRLDAQRALDEADDAWDDINKALAAYDSTHPEEVEE